MFPVYETELIRLVTLKPLQDGFRRSLKGHTDVCVFPSLSEAEMGC